MSPAELQASMATYLSQGGLVTALDYAGNVKGWHNGRDRDSDVVAIASPAVRKLVADGQAGPARDLRRNQPIGVAGPATRPVRHQVPAAVELPEPALTLRTERRIDAATQLRAIRLAARRAMFRLDRAFRA